jgi:hypothetical protein
MKRILLVAITFFAAASVNAQTCTPGANFADSVYGAWPDTTTNFPPGAAGVPYSTDLNFKVPTEVTPEVAGSDPTAIVFIGSPIQDFTVTGVTGLPSGFDYGCSVSSCTYTGGSNGCANLYGTGTTTGTYPLVINIDATILIDVPFVGPQPVTQATSFNGYKLVLGTAGVVEELIQPFSVHPNPASTKITLNGLSENLNITSIVLTNMEGKVIRTVQPGVAKSMDIDVSAFGTGIYFVDITHDLGKETIKFVKE